MLREMLDVMMPRECLVCGQKLGASEDPLCIWCTEDLPLTYYWERVHNPMADEFNALLERGRACGERMDYAYAVALLFYHHANPYKRIPQALKYSRNLSAGRYYAAELGRFMAAQPHFASVDLVLPVPLHFSRFWQRGYNQAQVIAARLAGALEASLRTDVLVRRRKTRTQTRLDADARLKNVSGVFHVKRTVPCNHILLVDDTFTTGATLAACYQVVRDAFGPGPRISVATLSAVSSQ